MFRLLKLPLISGFVLLITLCLSGCGLETIVYLAPPDQGSFSGEEYTFWKRTVNGDDPENSVFRGFEVYYKFYGPLEITDNNIEERETLVATGFRRIHSSLDRSGDINPPLIPITRKKSTDPPLVPAEDAEYEISIDFSTLPQPTVSWQEHSTLALEIRELRRAVDYDSSDGALYTAYLDQFEHFDYSTLGPPPAMDISDEDIDAGVVWDAISAILPVTMVLYALSYGKRDFSEDVYSQAVYLGELNFTF